MEETAQYVAQTAAKKDLRFTKDFRRSSRWPKAISGAEERQEILGVGEQESLDPSEEPVVFQERLR